VDLHEGNPGAHFLFLAARRIDRLAVLRFARRGGFGLGHELLVFEESVDEIAAVAQRARDHEVRVGTRNHVVRGLERGECLEHVARFVVRGALLVDFLGHRPRIGRCGGNGRRRQRGT
jgi:hypothetical protein